MMRSTLSLALAAALFGSPAAAETTAPTTPSLAIDGECDKPLTGDDVQGEKKKKRGDGVKGDRKKKKGEGKKKRGKGKKKKRQGGDPK